MSKVKWTQTAHCPWPDEEKLPGAHCETCRSGGFEGTTTEERYEIPDECPLAQEGGRRGDPGSSRAGLCKYANLVPYQSGTCGCKRHKNRCDRRGIVLGQRQWKRTCRRPGICDHYIRAGKS